MKIKNKYSLLFAFAVLFIALGCGRYYLGSARAAATEAIFGAEKGYFNAVRAFKEKVDDLGKTLRYHDTLLDINSIKENLLGTRLIIKPDTTVVKADNDMLLWGEAFQSNDRSILNAVDKIEKYQQAALKNDAKFLYCKAPIKQLYGGNPENTANFAEENQEKLFKELKRREIPCISFYEEFNRLGLNAEDVFFYTDHHWKPSAGFTAAGIVCEELNRRYGFTYDPEMTDISNYRITTHPDFFLGSLGKKSGTYFTWRGADDFDVIMPAFKTDFTEELPYSDEIRTGSFEDTLLHMDYLHNDHYLAMVYSVYCGGDHRLQIIKNNLNPGGAKILLIRDSFSCVAAPFIAPQMGEIHIVDDREGDYPKGEIVNIEEYAEKERFDYIIVIKQ